MTPAPADLLPWQGERRFLFTLAGIQFTYILGFMIMMPLGPQFIRELDITTGQFSLLLASYTFSAAIFNLLATTYIDRFDRRTLMLVLYAMFLVVTVACGIAPDFPTLLLGRAAAGATGGLLGAMVQIMVADVIPYERRGRAMGIVMAAMSVSAVAGVPIGLALANAIPSLGWRAPFFFSTGAIAIMLAVSWRVLPSLTSHLGQTRERNVFAHVFRLATDPNYIKAFLFILLLMMGSFSVTPYVPLYLTMNLGLPESFITLVYLCGGAANFATMQVIGRLSDKHGKLRTYSWVAFLSFIPVLTTTHLFPMSSWIILVNSTFFFILVSGRMGPAMALISAVPPPQTRGTFMGLVYSVQMLSFSLASLTSGLIIGRAASGHIERFNWVGYLAVACSAVTIWLAHRLVGFSKDQPAGTTVKRAALETNE